MFLRYKAHISHNRTVYYVKSRCVGFFIATDPLKIRQKIFKNFQEKVVKSSQQMSI